MISTVVWLPTVKRDFCCWLAGQRLPTVKVISTVGWKNMISTVGSNTACCLEKRDFHCWF